MVDMTVKSDILTKLIEIVLKKQLQSKLGKGMPVNLDIQSITVKVDDGTAHIGFNGQVDLPTKSVFELVKNNI